MRRLRERPDKHYRGERCTSRLNSHGTALRTSESSGKANRVKAARSPPTVAATKVTMTAQPTVSISGGQ